MRLADNDMHNTVYNVCIDFIVHILALKYFHILKINTMYILLNIFTASRLSRQYSILLLVI